MTRGDFILKWAIYALALTPILVLGLFLLPWFPIFGTVPVLLPAAAITVAVLEGPVAGAGYGLFVGVLSDAFIPGQTGTMTLALPILGIAAGIVVRYVLRQNLLGCLVCSAGALVVIDLFRVLSFRLRGVAPLGQLLWVALPEIFWSLLFTPLVYLVYRWVFRRVPQATVL